MGLEMQSLEKMIKILREINKSLEAINKNLKRQNVILAKHTGIIEICETDEEVGEE